MTPAYTPLINLLLAAFAYRFPGFVYMTLLYANKNSGLHEEAGSRFV
jgi:hypothetical protein